MTIEQRLNKELNAAVKENRSLKKKIEKLQVFSDNSWQNHRVLHNKFSGLPFPRLEMIMERTGKTWYDIKWIYGFAYIPFYFQFGREYKNKFLLIPVSVTDSCGGNGSFEDRCRNGALEMPFRDSKHIRCDAKIFNLPAFITCPEMGIYNEIK